MKYSLKKYSLNGVCILCACLLFMAVLHLPIAYYTVLRVIVFIGALFVISSLEKKQYLWIFVFAVIAILFNPILPVYLYIKAYWVPIDVISGILFLLVTFLKPLPRKQEKKLEKHTKSYTRDRIY